jgi:CubicO group peptidase (beta-lactamase class C family)
MNIKVITFLIFTSLQLCAFADDFKIILEKARVKYKLPALAAAATLNGKIIEAQVTGFRRTGDETKVTINDKFHIGSCTKSMTATLAGILVDQGKITWSTTLAETFPALKGKMHKDYRQVTLEQLLSHTAGMPSLPLHHKKIWGELYMNRLEKSATKQRAKMIKEVLPLGPIHPPGSKFLYSNCGVSIAGMMLEKTSRETWENLLLTYIAKPLKITTLGFNDAATSKKIDQPFNHLSQNGKITYLDPRLKPDNPAAIAPAGTVHCSVIDFAKYTTIYSMNGKGFLDKKTFDEILRPRLNNYALGWGTTTRHWGGNVITHTGSNNMNYAVMWISPDKNFSVVAMTNIAGKNATKATDEICGELIKKFLLKN